MLARLADAAMDATVIPGFSRIGYAARARSWDPLPRLDGRTVAITGATGGIGRAAAEGLAQLGADLVLLVRNTEQGEQLAGRLARAGARTARVVRCDLADLACVRAAAAQIPALDVLINNAGVLPGERTLSPDGFELTFATNVLGTFALTEALLPALREGRVPGRIITVSSGGMYAKRLDLDALQGTSGEFDGVSAYAQTKRAEVVLTDVWAERLCGTGIVAHAMHPGWVDTPGIQDALPGFSRFAGPILRTPEQGADTILWLAAAPEPATTSGGFWHDRRERPKHRLPRTHEAPGDAERLYDLCRTLTTEA